jgi:excisionase family DNA binding protein
MKRKTQYKGKRITVKDIAGYCLVSGITVRRWIRDGKLSAMKLPSGHYRITTAGFRDFLERYNMPIKEELFESEYKRKEVT